MKFVHIADMHFDRSFDSLANIEGLPQKRRFDQRKILKKVIDYIKENDIKFLFISGDFYEQETIRKTTIEYINNLFKEISSTKIFISPGNHDPLIKNSYYNTFNWNDNVKIFNSNIEVVKLDNINIYGFGFEDFYVRDSGIDKIILEDKNTINILITHASLDASKQEEMQYNAVNKSDLEKIGFDYIALGHIHKNNYYQNNRIIYPGSTIAQGFDELGEHGMIVGDINIQNKDIKLDFIKLDDTVFCEKEIDINDIYSDEELVEKIENLNLQDSNLYKIILIGSKNYSIDEKKILKLVNKENVLKIKNLTKAKYDLEKISEEESLRGFFIKECLEKMEISENKEMIQNAIEIGLEALEKN